MATWSILPMSIRGLLLLSDRFPDEPREEPRARGVRVFDPSGDAANRLLEPAGLRGGIHDGPPEPLLQEGEQPRPDAPLGATRSFLGRLEIVGMGLEGLDDGARALVPRSHAAHDRRPPVAARGQ